MPTIDEYLDLYGGLLPDTEIARRLGCGNSAVSARRAERSIPTSGLRTKRLQRLVMLTEWLCDQYEPVTIEAVAKRFGVSVKTAREDLHLAAKKGEAVCVDNGYRKEDGTRGRAPSLWVAA